MFIERKVQYCSDSILPKLIDEFNSISIKNSIRYFYRNQQTDSKIYMDGQRN